MIDRFKERSIKIGRLVKDLKWNYGIEIRNYSYERVGFFPTIRIWFFRLKRLPEVGESLEGLYKGFFWILEPLKHIEIRFKVFCPMIWFRGHMPHIMPSLLIYRMLRNIFKKECYQIPIMINFRR